MNNKVDFFFEKPGEWQQGLLELRKIILSCDLLEEVKWGTPCYTLEGGNVVLIHTFKNYFALLFFKGALMQDPEGLLVQQTRNTQATRQIRFTSSSEVKKLKGKTISYIQDAIRIERSGEKVQLKKTEEFEMAEEFQSKLKSLPSLKKAFEALTPGRQRAYLLYFSSAKQKQTCESRIEKCLPEILAGKGLND